MSRDKEKNNTDSVMQFLESEVEKVNKLAKRDDERLKELIAILEKMAVKKKTKKQLLVSLFAQFSLVICTFIHQTDK